MQLGWHLSPRIRCAHSSVEMAHDNREFPSHLLGRLLSKRQEMTRVGQDVERLETCALLVGMETGAATMENHTAGLPTIKNRITIGSSHSTCRYIHKRIESKALERYLYTHVQGSIIHKS